MVGPKRLMGVIKRMMFKPAPARAAQPLEELLAQCDPMAPETEEDLEWRDQPSVGREVL